MTEYRTTDSDRFAPYPNMTEDDLQGFEAWADEVDENRSGLISLFFVFVMIALLVIF